MNNNIKRWSLLLLLFVLVNTGCREDAILLEEFGTVNGQIFDSQTFLPIQSASVSTSPTTTTVLTDSLGFFELAFIPVGEYNIKIEKEDYRIEFAPVSVIKDRIVVININIEEGTTDDLAPLPPVLLSPGNGLAEQLEDVELTWSANPEYDEDDLLYDVVLIDDDALEVKVVEDTPETSFLLENLKYNTTYFWYVVAKDGVNQNSNSEVFSFKTRELTENLFLFVRPDNGLYQIYSSDQDGLNTIALTNNNTNNWCPQFSPDGSLISYISLFNNQNHIYVSDLDGNNARRITSGIPIDYYDQFEMDYCWSPDGTKVLYMNFDKLYLQEISTSGGPATQVLTTPDGNAFASCDWKDGQVLVRTTNSNGFESHFYLYDAETWTLLDEIAYYPQGRTGGPYFAKNGSSIVFTHDEHPSPPTLQGGEQGDAQIFYLPNLNVPFEPFSVSLVNKPAGTNDINPRFSPSGAFIIFSNHDIDGLVEPKVYRVNISEPENRTMFFENALMPDWRNP